MRAGHPTQVTLASLAPYRDPEPPERLRKQLAEGGSTLVALSGGVDSAVVALLAQEALGSLAHAVTIVGPAVDEEEAESALAVARRVGIDHEFVTVDPLSNDSYRQNRSDRCYHCRNTEATALLRWGAEHSVRSFVDGIQTDDLREVRPGLRAMAEAGFRHPLADAGWTKATVREFARGAHLPNAERPSNACLASRIRTGEPITAEALQLVERAERSLRAMGFRQVRVRVAGRSASIEVGAEELPRLQTAAVEQVALGRLQALGFDAVTVDPLGYHSRSSP